MDTFYVICTVFLLLIVVVVVGGGLFINNLLQQETQVLESFSCDELKEYLLDGNGGFISIPLYNERC